MKKIVKKNIFIAVLILIIVNAVIGFLLLKSRSFSHLSIWNIIESGKEDDFYWEPEDAPEYFHFEPESDNLSTFRTEITPVVKERNDEFEKVLRVARYVMDISSGKIQPHLSLKWDSPEGILRQIREGAGANCFHRAILFSTYLSSIGVKSRLWALENECFNDVAHSINEVYVKNLKKWVFIDVMYGFYATSHGRALSFLEFREMILRGDSDKISFHGISNEIKWQKLITQRYRKLARCVFLRAGNNFINKYHSRYEPISIFRKYLDSLPGDIRRGLDYLLSRQDIFIHYTDRFDKSLKPKIIIVKLLFYFFIVCLVSLGMLSVIFSSCFLKRYVAANLSKKETRHR